MLQLKMLNSSNLQTSLPLTKNNLSLATFANEVGTAADSQASNNFVI